MKSIESDLFSYFDEIENQLIKSIENDIEKLENQIKYLVEKW